MSEIDEPAFLTRLQRREPQAFATLVRAHQHRVFGLVLRIVGDSAEAEEVAQDVFVSVFRSIDSFRGDSRLSTWIFRIAVNLSKNRLVYRRRRHADFHEPIGDEQEPAASPFSWAPERPDGIAEARELEQIVQAGLARLEPEHREVLVLRDVEHLSYEEIAEVLGVAEGTVKSRLFRARYALKQQIARRYAP